jgi:hypothetical protein
MKNEFLIQFYNLPKVESRCERERERDGTEKMGLAGNELSVERQAKFLGSTKVFRHGKSKEEREKWFS